MNSQDAEIVERLKSLRERSDISQDEIAKAIGAAGRSTISKIENGSRKLSVGEAIAWAEACGASLSLVQPEDAELLRRYRDVEPGRRETAKELLLVAAQVPTLTWRLLKVQIEALVDEFHLSPDVKQK